MQPADILHKLGSHTPTRQQGKLTQASVLIPLSSSNQQGCTDIILTRRAIHMKTHRGQVAFPGGKQDTTDKSLLATALRETWEEVALPENQVTVLGQLSPVISRYGIEVTPFIGSIPDLSHLALTPNPNELDRIFSVPIHYLTQPENLRLNTLPTHKKYGPMPHWQYEEYTIWGLTALMLLEFLQVVYGFVPVFSQ